MAQTPKPVRKAIKARHSELRKKFKSPQMDKHFSSVKKGLKSMAKSTIKERPEALTKKGKPHKKYVSGKYSS